MCGISGLINKQNKAIEPLEIKKFNDLVAHRGPDSDGIYIDKTLALGHRRLAIIDLTEHGHQPMAYQNRYWITFNGEIYNYVEVRNDLQKLGYQFKTQSDTEVILVAYAHFGNEAFALFNGMWALAIYDKQEQKLILSRDRFGKKPLYYTHSDSIFAFGSELKQILSVLPKVQANHTVLFESILTQIDRYGDKTSFKDIKALPPSHFAMLDLRSFDFSLQRFYTLKANPDYQNLSLDEAVSTFGDLIQSSIDLRLRSDVKVGTCLSGGLDSSTISFLASKSYREQTGGLPFLGIHAQSIEKESDESEFAKKVAKAANIELHIINPKNEDFQKTVRSVIRTQEEPFHGPSILLSWLVFQKAAELGCKVMLDGQGGDEIFLGYERYLASISASKSGFAYLKALKNNANVPLWRSFVYSQYFTKPFLKINRIKRETFLTKSLISDSLFDSFRETSRVFADTTELQIQELTKTNLPQLLQYEDRNSMFHAIETRLPFLDYRLVEFGISISTDFKIRDGWTKYPIRAFMDKKLPDDIIWRKNKFGFVAPTKTWLDSYSDVMQKEVAQSDLLHKIIKSDNVIKDFVHLSLKDKWMLYNLAVWEQEFNVEF